MVRGDVPLCQGCEGMRGDMPVVKTRGYVPREAAREWGREVTAFSYLRSTYYPYRYWLRIAGMTTNVFSICVATDKLRNISEVTELYQVTDGV